MTKKRDRFFHAPRLPFGGLPRKVPDGKFIWHNHIQHCAGMSHGLNGFPNAQDKSSYRFKRGS